MSRITATLTTLFVGLLPTTILGQTEEVGPHHEYLKDLEYFVGEWNVEGRLETEFGPLVDLGPIPEPRNGAG